MAPDRDPEQPDVVVFGDVREARGPGRGRLRTLGLPAALAAVVVVAVVAHVKNSSGTVATPSPSPSPVAPVTVPEPSLPTGAPAVTEAGHPLLGITAGWELFGRGPDGIVRIELARGRVTSTAVPPVGSSGPISFIAGPDAAIIRPLDPVAGFLVPDGKPARALTGPLATSGPALPGPDPAHVWAPHPTSTQTTAMDLVGFDGRPTGVSVPLPEVTGGYAAPDGAGYLTVYAVGGLYDLRPGSVRRITTGQELAVGPTGWLTMECDDQLRCSTVVVDRSTWERRIVGPVVSNAGAWGVISPDGRTAAIRIQSSGDAASVHLIDLSTGANHLLSMPVTGDEDASMVWSPDSRWLFVAGSDGRVHAIDAKGRDHDLGIRLPVLTQLALRAY